MLNICEHRLVELTSYWSSAGFDRCGVAIYGAMSEKLKAGWMRVDCQSMKAVMMVGSVSDTKMFRLVGLDGGGWALRHQSAVDLLSEARGLDAHLRGVLCVPNAFLEGMIVPFRQGKGREGAWTRQH